MHEYKDSVLAGGHNKKSSPAQKKSRVLSQQPTVATSKPSVPALKSTMSLANQTSASQMSLASQASNTKQMNLLQHIRPTLAGSTLSDVRYNSKDFRSQFISNPTTFGGIVNGKINRTAFQREYSSEFKGIDAPPATKYNPDQGQKDILCWDGNAHENKTQPRDQRVCPMVSRHQLSIPAVGPQSYVGIYNQSEFLKNRNNSTHFGSRAIRNTDVRQYAQQNHQKVSKGLLF